ncbi:MAG TPA: DJ-1/PfpI family protein [Myxococcota bacterium]|nr:DJ-1/PfpI family protein [Myxococcota bacterium]
MGGTARARSARRAVLAAALACVALVLAARGVRAGESAGPRRPDGARPVVVIVAENQGTETTDFLVPFGVLSASGAAEVVAASTQAGPVQLMPALEIETSETLSGFDAKHPEGADYVVVPAMHDREDASLVAWLRGQGELGATLVGICDGAWLVAATGRLEGHTATAHWYSRAELAKRYPGTTWVEDRRFVDDGDVVTTTGVSASLPASLHLVERMAGRARAEAVAHELGVVGWSAAHHGEDFRLSFWPIATGAWSWLAFWTHEPVGIPVAPGVDEVSLGLTADALARTLRATPITVADTAAPLSTRFGLALVPDATRADATDLRLEALDAPPGRALDRALDRIQAAYGRGTADLVSLELEYPRPVYSSAAAASR